MNDTVKRDNRRSFPLFLLVILLSAVLGAAAGFFSAMAADRGTLDAIWAGLDRLMEAITPWAIPVCSAVLLIPGLEGLFDVAGLAGVHFGVIVGFSIIPSIIVQIWRLITEAIKSRKEKKQ